MNCYHSCNLAPVERRTRGGEREVGSPAEVHQVDEGGEVLDLVGQEMGGGVGGLQHHSVDVVRALSDDRKKEPTQHPSMERRVLASDVPTVCFF